MAMEHAPMQVLFTSKDVKRFIDFYTKKLGFKLEQSWPDEKNPQWANLMLDNQSVMVGGSMEAADIGKTCGGDSALEGWWKTKVDAYKKNAHGVGVLIYIKVPDVDTYYADVKKRGAEPALAPKTQFYGIRDFALTDPDGYDLCFYEPVTMESCQSCGMPLTEGKPGQMYCHYCADETGKLHPYEHIFEGTVTGYFMGMQKMGRSDAEKAAKEHLAKMPAWAGRG